ncbi:PiggyBac transposable element-derived protein 4 [Eumeta japonica]|uniref:PiggyBac transposable element-derived protein 4 n=1 Tax=Eumeta variegata TaxID=151549 RepID=A0A4C1SIF4_EUMVA|nr:PiggyBac transposable element-derived protein 4 [Eumeta japonica]
MKRKSDSKQRQPYTSTGSSVRENEIESPLLGSNAGTISAIAGGRGPQAMLPRSAMRVQAKHKLRGGVQVSSENCPMRSSHCPAVRSGPALSCNYCWNTVDERGRILRRKTKYHCPECRTNLCIVPCFHLYHARNAENPPQ